MSLQVQLLDEMKQAMRDRDALRLSVIRFLRSEIKNVEIDQGEIDDAAILKIISKQIKQMQEAADQFVKGDRPELAAEEHQKIAILEAYVPAQLSDEELAAIISQVMADTSEPAIKTVMPAVMACVAGRADGRRVSQMVQEALKK